MSALEGTGRLNPTKGHMLPGVQINEHMFLSAVEGNQLFQLTRDPRDSEDKKKIAASRDLQVLFELREDVQRLFEGEKKKNVPSYAKYICSVHRGGDGMAPPIILYSEDFLNIELNESGIGFVQIPWGRILIAIDGETQLAARYEAANMFPKTSDEKIAVFIVHGYSKSWARQSFHDLNVYGVKPNTALGIGMDARDPLTQVARDVEEAVPFLRDRVNKSRRQLRLGDSAVMTITALRGACITLAEGISGVKYGSKSAPVRSERVPMISQVAKEWFGALTEAFGPAMEDREGKLAGAPSVLAALGALGHDLTKIESEVERKARMRELIRSLADVDWRRGKRWEGIAGKFTPKGIFSVGGSKETAYAVYDALADRGSPAYERVRNSVHAAAAE